MTLAVHRLAPPYTDRVQPAGPAVVPADLTPRELAVAALCGRRLTVKRMLAVLDPPISKRRVYAIITAVATKIGVPEGADDHLCVGDWWREQCPISTRDDAAA